MSEWKRLLLAASIGAALLWLPADNAAAADEETDSGSSAPCGSGEDVGNEGCDEVEHEEEEDSEEDEDDDDSDDE